MQAGNIRRVLIANRGEIALRIVRACRELGIETVAIYSSSESNAEHVRAADDAWVLPPFDSLAYLNVEGIVEIAVRSRVDAVHPGYGFLAENASFARAVEGAGLIFIGPPAESIEQMGDKIAARKIAIGAGIQPVPGTIAPISDLNEAITWADTHGYPVAVKASGGGGGRGFRVAATAEELSDAYQGSRGEAERYFANPDVYLERYLEHPRHIEVQIFADAHGVVLAFPERDCSIQRRHQKLIEESPSPAVDPDLRMRLGQAAVELTRAVDYRGAGTIEFLLDQHGEFYFLEMNTRIQVEHTISEMVTGIDLVKEQIRVANGLPLSFDQDDLQPNGWAIEARINAEDAGRNFAPVSGVVTTYREPTGFGVRIDAALREGGSVAPEFDSLIAKLVVWGRDRDEALSRLRRTLDEYVIEGVPTTIPFHVNVAGHPEFEMGNASTTFIVDYPEVIPSPQPDLVAQTADDPMQKSLVVEVNGRRFDVSVAGDSVSTARSGTSPRNPRRDRLDRAKTVQSGNVLISPVQGTVIRVAAELGSIVSTGDLICVVEAMKMENELTAHRAGTITDLYPEVGSSIKIGATIAVISD